MLLSCPIAFSELRSPLLTYCAIPRILLKSRQMSTSDHSCDNEISLSDQYRWMNK
jgi:hypothetical protein